MHTAILLTAAFAAPLGLLTAFVMEVIMGRMTARQFPGASLAAGLAVGAPMAGDRGLGILIVGAVSGFIGWLLYRRLRPAREAD